MNSSIDALLLALTAQSIVLLADSEFLLRLAVESLERLK